MNQVLTACLGGKAYLAISKLWLPFVSGFLKIPGINCGWWVNCWGV